MTEYKISVKICEVPLNEKQEGFLSRFQKRELEGYTEVNSDYNIEKVLTDVFKKIKEVDKENKNVKSRT